LSIPQSDFGWISQDSTRPKEAPSLDTSKPSKTSRISILMTIRLKSSKKLLRKGRGSRQQPGRHKMKLPVRTQELTNRKPCGNVYGEWSWKTWKSASIKYWKPILLPALMLMTILRMVSVIKRVRMEQPLTKGRGRCWQRASLTVTSSEQSALSVLSLLPSHPNEFLFSNEI